MRFGQPHVAGVSTEAIAEAVWVGETIEEAADEYGLTRAQVLVACWYMARYGSRMWRKRWAGWLVIAEDRMWRSLYDFEDPPCRVDGAA